MSGLIRGPLRGLAAQLAELQERVRVAVAAELARIVGGAVQQVVVAAVGSRGPSTAEHRTVSGRWSEDGSERWDDRDAWSDREPNDPRRDRAASSRPAVDPAAVVAVAAAVHAARWWLSRRGTLLGAAGLSLGVGIVGLCGGALARTVVALVAAAADILSASDALHTGASRLEHL